MKNFYGEREDITQQNFKNFMHDIHADRRTPFGFSSKGVIVLTDDYHLFEALRHQQEKKDKRRVRVLQYFGLGSGELSATTSLNDKWTNSIYYEQQSCIGLLTDHEIGGAHLLILTESAEKLKEYTQTVLDYHVKSCKISLDSSTWLSKYDFNHCPAPTLYFYITVANKFSNVKFDDGVKTIADYPASLTDKGSILYGLPLIDDSVDKLIANVNSVTTD